MVPRNSRARASRAHLAVLSLLALGAWTCGGDSDLFSAGPVTTTSGGGATSSGAGGGGAASSSGDGGSSSTSSSGGGSGGSSSGAGGDGGSGTGIGAPCTWDGAPCDPNLYCQAEGCGAGTCQPVIPQTAQEKQFAPICGCDGINYFNPSIAASFGMSIAHGDRCTENEQIGCHKTNNPCAQGYFCNRTVASLPACMLSPIHTGECWAVPLSCDPNGPQAKACANSLCYDLCSLIQSENPWYGPGTC